MPDADDEPFIATAYRACAPLVAVAIMGGLIVATMLTLLALLAMYAAWFRVRREEPPATR